MNLLVAWLTKWLTLRWAKTFSPRSAPLKNAPVPGHPFSRPSLCDNSTNLYFPGSAGDEESRTTLRTTRARFLASLARTLGRRFYKDSKGDEGRVSEGFSICTLTLLIVVVAVTSPARAAVVADCHLVQGWEQRGVTRHYTPDNLFEYLNGSAEGYILYGLVQMQGVTCGSKGGSITIDVFEMNDADSAYGVFTTNLDPQMPIEKLGMGGQVLPRRALFCKGKYYVELAANPAMGGTTALRAFATEAEKRITGRSTPPAALSWFPAAKLASVRLIPESVLGLRLLKRGFVAHYEQGQAFVVMEATPGAAAAVLSQLRQRFGEATSAHVADEAFQTDDQYLGGLCMFRKGRYIGGFANMPDARAATTQAASLAEHIPGM